MTPRYVLDLFCGAGGAAMGLHRAWPDALITGVDINPQPRYPAFHDAPHASRFRFAQADAMTFDLSGYDFIWASPPCQAYTLAQNAAQNADAHPDLVAPVRDRLVVTGALYVIENVVRAPLLNPSTLCGLSFGLKVRRHRLFESNFFFLAPPCQCKNADYYVIFGKEVRSRRHGERAGRKNKIAEGRRAMGIDWMTRGELSQAIPPAYSEFIARQLTAALEVTG